MFWLALGRWSHDAGEHFVRERVYWLGRWTPFVHMKRRYNAVPVAREDLVMSRNLIGIIERRNAEIESLREERDSLRAMPLGATQEVREALAEYAHDAWAGWMMYLFGKCIEQDDGTAIIPKWAVLRWRRQVSMSYKSLSSDEQGADYREADRMIEIVRAHGNRHSAHR